MKRGSFKTLLSRYDYSAPRELIAETPASPRDYAKLLVYQRTARKTIFDRFINLPAYLPKGAVLVLNDTKVIPARLPVKKETGGNAELLFIRRSKGLIETLANHVLPINSRVYVTPRIFFSVCAKKGRCYILKPSFLAHNLYAVLTKYGKTPLPPYLRHSPLPESARRKQYQSVFAHKKGSIAAPTASLHFTKRLLNRIRRAGYGVRFVTLHVNLGTFAPLEERQLISGMLHGEQYKIDANTARALMRAKRAGRPIIAVGTTVVRALESAADARGTLRTLRGDTRLFIKEGYRFKFVDGIITNFHVPKSSLLMLIGAYTGRNQLFRLYQAAIQKGFRFFSFGDGMFVSK